MTTIINNIVFKIKLIHNCDKEIIKLINIVSNSFETCKIDYMHHVDNSTLEILIPYKIPKCYIKCIKQIKKYLTKKKYIYKLHVEYKLINPVVESQCISWNLK